MMLLNLAVSPVAFFRAKLGDSSCWGLAATAVLLSAVASGAGAVITTIRVQPLIDSAMLEAGLQTVEGVPVGLLAIVGIGSNMTLMVLLFAAQAFVLCCFYWLSPSKPVGSPRRLVEMAGIAHFVRLPLWIAGLVVPAMMTVAPISFPANATQADLLNASMEHQNLIASNPLVLTMRMIEMYFGLWIAALQGVALRVVSGCSTTWAVIAAAVLGAVFSVGPWALQRF